MKRIAWNLIGGVGAAALLVATPLAQAGDDQHKEKSRAGTTAQGATQTDTSTSESAQKGDERAATSMAGTPSASSDNQMKGKIEKYDRAEKTLTLEGSDKKLKLGDDVQVTKDGQMASPGDLQEGDEVRASFAGAPTGETVEILVIEVLPAEAMGTGTSAPSTGSSAGPDTSTGSSGTGSTGTTPGGSKESSGSTSTGTEK